MTTEHIDGPIGPLALHHLSGEGDTVLLIAHATGFLGRVYRAFAREMPKDLRVMALDFRGHGDSVVPTQPEQFAWSGMADDLETVVDYLDAETLHGFAHSMGGAALLEVERRAPATFASAVVFEPIVPPGPFGGDSPLVAGARGRLQSFPSRADALARYASKPPLGLFRADVLHDYVTHGFRDDGDEVTLKCAPENEASTFANAGQITIDHLSSIDLAVVVGKSGDGGPPARLADEVVRSLPNGQLRSFPTISHFGPLQDPVLVAHAVAEVITAVSE